MGSDGVIRKLVTKLAMAGQIEVLKKGVVLDPSKEMKGIIRLRIKRDLEEEGVEK